MNRDNNTPLNIEEIHEGTIEILRKLINICDEIGIDYYIAYGSLIGAVRHKGFIPWDDDLDVTMMRADYEKFVDYCIANAESIYPFGIVNRKVNSKYPYNISRFCDNRYRIETKKHSEDAGIGMFIDIYPYDLSDSRDNSRVIEDKIKYARLATFAINKDIKYIKEASLFHNVKRLFYYTQARVMGLDRILNDFSRLQEKYAKASGDIVSCLVWDESHDDLPAECFKGYEYLEFEGIKVKAPVNYDVVLKNIYGDYMQMPPEDKRVPNHEYLLYRKE